MRSAPYLTFNEPPKRDYNLRLGPLNGRFFGSMQVEYSDNINLAETGAAADVYFYPNFGIGIQWPLSAQNLLEFSLGLGYRAYVDHPDLNSFQISPDSRLSYMMRIGKVNVILRDNFQLQIDPLTRADISGGTNGALLDFRRFVNDAGVQAEWPARQNLSIISGYDFVLDRSLSDDFKSLDRNDHTLSLGANSQISASWSLGLSSAVTFSHYLQQVQNDGVSYSVGPQTKVKVTRFLTLEGSVAYTRSDYDQTGTILDNSDFSGVSFALAANHNINSRMSQSARAARSVSPGFGSNYNELSVLQYNLSWRFNSFFGLNTTFVYEHLKASGGGEIADRYVWYLGGSWDFARRWRAGLGYSLAWKDSDQPGRNYQQNRVTLDVTHDF